MTSNIDRYTQIELDRQSLFLRDESTHVRIRDVRDGTTSGELMCQRSVRIDHFTTPLSDEMNQRMDHIREEMMNLIW